MKNDNGLRVSIFARKIVQGNPIGDAAFSMILTDRASIAIFASELPPEFKVAFNLPGTSQMTISPFVPKLKFGVVAEYKDGEVKISKEDAPELEMSDMDYLKRLNEDGSLQDASTLNECILLIVR